MAGQASLEELGERVREALATAMPEEPATRRGRVAFLARVHQPPRRRSWRLAGLTAGVVLGAVALALVWPWTNARPSDFLAGGVPGKLGALVAAGGVPLPLQFAEGSAIDLEPLGQLQVARLDAEAAQVTLGRGRAHLRIRKRQGRTWAVHAGPFSVQVTGTRFSVDWQPEEKRMEVVLHEGSVIVSGACMAEPRTMIAPDRLEAHCAPQAAPSSFVKADVLPPSLPPPAGARARLDPYAWRALVAQGQYERAVRQARRVGVSKLCAEAAADQLQDLADAARLGGDTSTAHKALLALRRRFPRTPEGSLAAFHLGRLASDLRGDPAAAASHFADYLAEQPHGALVGDAWGRLLEARARLPVDDAARQQAERYLALFPNGPYAALARRLFLRARP